MGGYSFQGWRAAVALLNLLTLPTLTLQKLTHWFKFNILTVSSTHDPAFKKRCEKTTFKLMTLPQQVRSWNPDYFMLEEATFQLPTMLFSQAPVLEIKWCVVGGSPGQPSKQPTISVGFLISALQFWEWTVCSTSRVDVPTYWICSLHQHKLTKIYSLINILRCGVNSSSQL